jgi:hypothetical protein
MSAHPQGGQGDAPAPLTERMESALAGADPSDAESVAAAALARLRSALDCGDDRAAAYELLTADALLTDAAAAAQGADNVSPSLSAQAFAALLEQA